MVNYGEVLLYALMYLYFLPVSAPESTTSQDSGRIRLYGYLKALYELFRPALRVTRLWGVEHGVQFLQGYVQATSSSRASTRGFRQYSPQKYHHWSSYSFGRHNALSTGGKPCPACYPD
jgi:hypothetical protein